ncbi:type VII secretion protein EccB [Mycolicibacterium sp. XJ1819]
MARQPTTRLQVSGYRFLLRRMEHALVRGDARMLDDPLRAQTLSLIAGGVLAAIVVAVCAVLAVMQPRATVGTEPIVVVRETGALYVRIGETVHPVLNLASARLIAGVTGQPSPVSASALDGVRRGPLVGIPGAPDAVGRILTAEEAAWTVCDDAAGTTTVSAGPTVLRPDPGRSVLVTVRGESAATTYLVFDGRRARVDLRNHAVARALRLDGVAPRPVSRTLLDAIPEAREITEVSVPRVGEPSMLRGLAVGTVARVIRAEAPEYYVVLAHGVQRIGEVAADLIRFSHPGGRREIVTVTPGVLGSAPDVNDLPVAQFPDRARPTEAPVLCTQWTPSGTDPKTTVSTGKSLPWDGESLRLAQADGPGPQVDDVHLPPGSSAYVRAAGLAGEGASSASRYLVTDAGVVFGIRDEQTAERLGLTEAPISAPWPVVARLPRGQELSVEAASVVRDSVGAPS